MDQLDFSTLILLENITRKKLENIKDKKIWRIGDIELESIEIMRWMKLYEKRMNDNVRFFKIYFSLELVEICEMIGIGVDGISIIIIILVISVEY